MDSVERFAQQAAAFREWARGDTSSGELAAREALLQITQLFLAALALPDPFSESLSEGLFPDRVEDEEWKAVRADCARIPVDYYGEIYNPLIVPPDAPVIGSISDDIADIYRDVVTGLRAYEAGRRADAIYEWAYNFRSHWGEHATGVIRTLHLWLAELAMR